MDQVAHQEARVPDPAYGIRWDLTEILPSTSGKLFQSLVLDRLEGMLVEFENSRSDLTSTISKDRFAELLREYEALNRLMSRLNSYAYMNFSQDTRSQDARTFQSRVQEILADAENRIIFFELWWRSISEEKSRKLLMNSGNFSYFLRHLILTKAFTLSEPVEQTINLKDVTGKMALLQLYHQIRDSFSYDVVLEGSSKKMSEEQVRDLFHSASAEARREAYRSMLSKFEQNKDILGEIYKSLVNDWRNEGIKLRKYKSPISIRNIANDVPDESVSALLSTCEDNVRLFQRFFGYKAKKLGLSEMSRTDVYSPMPVEAERTFSWNEARDLITSTFESFDESFASMASNVFNRSHIDAEPRRGKMGGAYCMSVTPDLTPYILTSYTGKTQSVFTLSHELGHAIHSQLSAAKNDNQLALDAALPLAETASVFAELLLTDRLLSDSDDNTRKTILVDLMNDSYGTIIRQAFFVLFELRAHEKIAGGVSIDDLCDLYYDNLKNQFGDSLVIPNEFRNEWFSIPHIYQAPFYCYSYAWGNLLVMALYSEFKAQGAPSFAPKYIKMLSYGGAEAPEKILTEAGFDIRSRSFWQGGFNEISKVMSDLERSA